MKREYFISSRILSEDRSKIINNINDRFAKTIGVEVTILTVLLYCSNLNLNI